MNKSIVIIDTPESCSKCPLFGGFYSDLCCKALNNRGINYPYPQDFRQEWCPLKPLPEKETRDCLKEWSNGYKSGWNKCLDAILGE